MLLGSDPDPAPESGSHRALPPRAGPVRGTAPFRRGTKQEVRGPGRSGKRATDTAAGDGANPPRNGSPDSRDKARRTIRPGPPAESAPRDDVPTADGSRPS